MTENELADLFKIAEVELVYKPVQDSKHRLKIHSSQDAYYIFRDSWNMNTISMQTQFKLLLLDRENTCLGLAHIATGGMFNCIVDPKIVFATAVTAKACNLVLAHNHPSGSLEITDNDTRFTDKLNDGARIMEMVIFDHLILTANNYVSMSDHKRMPVLRGPF